MNSEAQTVSFWGTFNERFGGDDARQEPQRAARSKQIDRAPIGRCARPQRRSGIWPRCKRDEPGTGGSTVSPRQTATQLSGWLHLCYIYILSSGRNGRTPNTTRADAEVAVETTGPLDTRSGNPGSSVHPKMQGILHAPQASLGRDGCRVPCLCFCAISATGGAVKAVSPAAGISDRLSLSTRLRHIAMLSFFSLLNLQSAAVFVETDTRQNGEPHPSSACQLKIGCDPGNATRNAVRRPWIRRQGRVPRRREGAASVQKNRYTCP